MNLDFKYEMVAGYTNEYRFFYDIHDGTLTKDDLTDLNKRELNTLCEWLEKPGGNAIIFAKQFPEYKEFLKKFINHSTDAYNWALEIGHQDEMIDYIDCAQDAYLWITHVNENHARHLHQCIDEPKWAYKWARVTDVGKRRMHRVVRTSPEWTLEWAITYSDCTVLNKEVIHKSNNEQLIASWNNQFPSNKIEI